MKKVLFVVLIAFCLFLSNVRMLYPSGLEEQRPISIGFWGNLNLNFLSPDFYLFTPTATPLLGVKFDENSTGFSGAFGFLGNFPINNTFVISGRFGYNWLYGKTEHINSDTTFTTSIGFFEISPVLIVFPEFLPKNGYILGGLEFGFPVYKSYIYKEGNSENSEPTFSDPATRIALVLGGGYEMFLSPNFTLAPEISFRLPLNALNKDMGDRNGTNLPYYIVKLDVPQLRIGASITFNLTPRTEEQKITKTASELSISMKEIRSYDDKGNPFLVDKITVEDVQYTELFPLIPYIFFEQNSTQLLAKNHVLRDISEAGEFRVENLPPDAIFINQRLLDIVGKRLLDNPGAELTLTGTRDNQIEDKNKNLSVERANYIKEYFVQNWNINPERINVKAVGMPSKPSTMRDPDGIAENRRVELSSSNPKILEPILIERENQRIATPRLVEFVPAVYSSDPIIFWQIEISQGDNKLRNFIGSGTSEPIVWNIYPNELTSRNIPVDYTFTVRNAGGTTKRVSGSIPVEYISFAKKKVEDLPNTIISRFSLVLFDFDKADVSPADLEIINKYIVPAIKFNSTVKIYGYTDRIGEEEYNKNLAYRRALAVKNILEQKVKSAKYEIIPKGESQPIFDQNLAIGRHLSRTVIVEIITPK